MVWEGIAWKGMVWEGMVWKGMVWEGIVWKGMVWKGIVWEGMVRKRKETPRGMLLHSMSVGYKPARVEFNTASSTAPKIDPKIESTYICDLTDANPRSAILHVNWVKCTGSFADVGGGPA
jgi:hypothetical protein